MSSHVNPLALLITLEMPDMPQVTEMLKQEF